MLDDATEDKKTTALARVERLRELLEENADAACLEQSLGEIRLALDDLIEAEGEPPGESLPAL